MIKKISHKIGLTETELKVIGFLITAFLAGFAFKAAKGTSSNSGNYFDYSVEDSLFENAGNDENLVESNAQIKDKKVDYKQEVLDFNKRNFTEKKSHTLPKEGSIDINKADNETLISLPGIGVKTAENIIRLRETKGGFHRLKELLDVKGIGNSKYNKIKKYLYIE